MKSLVSSRPIEPDDVLKAAEAFRLGYAPAPPTLLNWSKRFRFEEGARLDFDTFPFQEELYEAFGDKDQATVDVMKSAQCGISAAGVSMALFAADVWAASVLYVLPTGDFAYQFSDTRVKPAIESSGWLRHRVASTDNKSLKRIGEAFLYFVGSVSDKKALSIPGDILVLDEYDRLAQNNVPKFRRRLNSPKSMKLERRFSNPTFPETGIHELFLNSDQREWLVRCPKCKHQAEILYEAQDDEHYVDEARVARVCGRCRRPLPVEAVAGGIWVARYPKVDRRGYHISRLNVPTETIGALVEAHQATAQDEVQTHYNFDLGLPYSPRGGSLSRELVYACRRDVGFPESYRGSDWVTAGVDVGAVLHVRISRWMESGKAAPLFIGEIAGFTELAQLWDRYDVSFGVIDERPEERAARAFATEHMGQVLLCRWSGEEQRDPLVVDDDQLLLIARRTGACDRLVAAITTQMRLLPRDLPKGYDRQLIAPHRTVETTSRGQKVARYVSEKADHYFFAECYDLLAREARPAPAMAAGPEPTTIREEVRRRRRRGS